jgi:hypothetical protein
MHIMVGLSSPYLIINFNFIMYTLRGQENWQMVYLTFFFFFNLKFSVQQSRIPTSTLHLMHKYDATLMHACCVPSIIRHEWTVTGTQKCPWISMCLCVCVWRGGVCIIQFPTYCKWLLINHSITNMWGLWLFVAFCFFRQGTLHWVSVVAAAAINTKVVWLWFVMLFPFPHNTIYSLWEGYVFS